MATVGTTVKALKQKKKRFFYHVYSKTTLSKQKKKKKMTDVKTVKHIIKNDVVPVKHAHEQNYTPVPTFPSSYTGMPLQPGWGELKSSLPYDRQPTYALREHIDSKKDSNLHPMHKMAFEGRDQPVVRNKHVGMPYVLLYAAALFGLYSAAVAY